MNVSNPKGKIVTRAIIRWINIPLTLVVLMYMTAVASLVFVGVNSIEPTKLSAQSSSGRTRVYVLQDSIAFGSADVDSLIFSVREFSYTIWPIGANLLLKILPSRSANTVRPSKYIVIQDGASITLNEQQANKIWFTAATGDTGAVFLLGLRTKEVTD